MSAEIIQGDCLLEMPKMAPESVDLIVTDPPYFLVNESGSGFMGKAWDSINTDSAYGIVCKSKEFASFVVGLLRLLKVESNTVEERTVHQLASMNSGGEASDSSLSPVPSAENQSKGQGARSSRSSSSVQGFALTKGAVLDLLKELSPSPTDLSFVQGVSENVLFAMPYSLLGKEPRNIAQDDVSRSPTGQPCGAKTILLSSTDEARISGVIGAMTGLKSESRFTSGTVGAVGYAESTVENERFRLITSSLTERAGLMHWIISSLYASNVTRKSNTIQKSSLTYSLLYQFHRNWATEAIRVLKPGAFAFVMAPPRSDILSQVAAALRDSGFDTNFSFVAWAYASGFPKSQNMSKTVDKKLGLEREVVGTVKGMGRQNPEWNGTAQGRTENSFKPEYEASVASSPEAKTLDGSYAGWQPKPAVEVIIVAMKPLEQTIRRSEVYRILGGRYDYFYNADTTVPELTDKNRAEVEKLCKKLSTKYGIAVEPKDRIQVRIALRESLKDEQLKNGTPFKSEPFTDSNLSSFVVQALKNGHGVTWLDQGRVPINPEVDDPRLGGKGEWHTTVEQNIYGGGAGIPRGTTESDEKRRFPANLLCGTGIDINLDALLELQRELKK